MQILLQEVVPSYFEKSNISNSEIWGKEIAFNKGEHIHIVAPSGSGKTSLIHFIYGLRREYQGKIFCNEYEIKSGSLEKLSLLRQKTISIIFQDLRLFQDQTVINNLELKRQLNPYHPPEKINEMALRLGIETKLDKIAKTCSYGEQQRIAVIRSLLQPFDFLLLDEPFSHLDDNNRLKAIELIKEECKQRNASMIFADLKLLDYFKDDRILRL